MYSKYLKSNRILMAIMMGCFRFAEDYTNTIFSMAIGIVVILCLKPIFEKYYPKPKWNLNIVYISERLQESLRPISRCAMTTVVAPMGR